MHEDCARARVAIDVLSESDPARFALSSLEHQLHIGHARTVLLGSLIAQELGLPFHIRLDGNRHPAVSLETAILLPLVTIVSQLDIQCEKVYWQAPEPPPLMMYEKVHGDKGKDLYDLMYVIFDGTDCALGVLADDLLYHHPSLYIRGVEFTAGAPGTLRSPHGGSTTADRYLAREDKLFELIGCKRHEINVPLIFEGGAKVSKSLGPRLTWEMFESIEGRWTRDFLLATAMRPDDPLRALGRKFSLDRMTTEPYEWSWEVWNEYIRLKEDDQ